jgi:hypothetical protein
LQNKSLIEVPPIALLLSGTLIGGGLLGIALVAYRYFRLQKNRGASTSTQPSIRGLSPLEIHLSIQQQILNIQATDKSQPEHALSFNQLITFLQEACTPLPAEAAILERSILQLKAQPPSDLSHLNNLSALFTWSKQCAHDLTSPQK